MSESEVRNFLFIFMLSPSFIFKNQQIEAIILECKKEFAHVNEISHKLMKEKDELKIKQFEVILNIKIKKYKNF